MHKVVDDDSDVPDEAQPETTATPKTARQVRLAAALRENLKRRKHQQRSRTAAPIPSDPTASPDQPITRGKDCGDTSR